MWQGQDEAGLGQDWCRMDPGWDGAMVKGPGLAVGCRRKHVLPGWRLCAGLYLRVLIPAGWGMAPRARSAARSIPSVAVSLTIPRWPACRG